MTSPMYIAEISPARIRGRMVSLNQFAIVFGMLVVYFVNYFIAGQGDEAWNVATGWRWMFGSEALPAVLLAGAAVLRAGEPALPASNRAAKTRRGACSRGSPAPAHAEREIAGNPRPRWPRKAAR